MDKNAGMEAQAAQLFQRGQYKEALQTYTTCIEHLTKNSKQELKISLIFNRSACYLKLKQFQKVVEDCNLILMIDQKNAKALGRKIKALCSLGNFGAAQTLANQWIQSDPLNAQARKEWERLDVIVKALKEQDDEDGLLCGPTEKVSPKHKTGPQPSRLVPATTQVAYTGSVWASQPNIPSDPWQTDMKKEATGGYDMAWGRASNATWDGPPGEKTSVDFPVLNKGPRSNTSLVWSNNPGSSMQPWPASSAAESGQSQTVSASSYSNTTRGQHVFGEVTFQSPFPMADLLQQPADQMIKKEPGLENNLKIKSEPTRSRVNEQGAAGLWGTSITSRDFNIKTEKEIKAEPQSPLEHVMNQGPSQTQSVWGSYSKQNPDSAAGGTELTFAGLASQPEVRQKQPNGQDAGLDAALNMSLRFGLDSVANNHTVATPGQSRFSLYKALSEKKLGSENHEQHSKTNTKMMNNATLRSPENMASTFNLAKSVQSSSAATLFPSSSGQSNVARIGQSFIPHVIQTKLLSSKAGMTSLSNGRGSSGSHAAQKVSAQPARNTNGPKSDVVQTTSVQECMRTEPMKGDAVLEGDVHLPIKEAIDERIELAKEETKTSDIASTHEREEGAEKKERRVWRHRQPPRGLTSQEYSVCHRYTKFGHCPFGENCWQAHSEEELQEWKERFEQRRQSLHKSRGGDIEDMTYAETLMEKLLRAQDASTVMVENLEGVYVHVNTDLKVTMSSKKCSQTWLLTVTSKMNLQHICLLDDANRKHFHIASITVGPKKSQKTQKVKDHCQEWLYHDYKPGKDASDKIFRIKIQFKTDIFGTFRQTVVLDFGSEPVIQRELCVDSSPVTDIDKLTNDLVLSESGRWDTSKIDVIEFEPKRFPMSDEERLLLESYPLPSADKIATASHGLADHALTRENYKNRMHSLLYIEEMAQFSSISKYNINIHLQLVKSFLLMPATVSTAKYAQDGELFARLTLGSDVSEDTSHGRLILQNVHTVLLAPAAGIADGKEPEKVYEALIEEKGKNFVFLRLSAQCTKDLDLKADTELHAQIQFQLNRMPLVEMHLALDLLPDLGLVFPVLTPGCLYPAIPWTPGKQWQDKLDSRLNAKQKEAMVAITTERDVTLSPVLIVGPYGTGKTFTLAQTAKQILKQDNTRILICAHSNSAADIYIREYLHPYVIEGHSEALPLRVYYRQRWVQTVNPVVLQYCLTRQDRLLGTVFVNPTKEDVENHRVVVCTLATSRFLYNIGLKPGHFTHILVDEAAQALECETIMPLALANANTRIVLAGDHMQLSPEVHSEFAKDRNLDVSFLERMFDIYPHDFPCKILLCENYRSHKSIIEFTSELFYESKLLASGNQPKHDKFWPLTFFTAQGEDIQHQNCTGFYNNAEVYEIVERVSELTKSWPECWGSPDDGAIGVVAPYTDQVVRIRSELRKKKLFSVSVERVLNVQGKQFRAIFLSTVRTRHTCSSDSAIEEVVDYGFLSNVKLLNTAMTRAQSLVAVVGDPVSLCSIGKCRKLWERFLELCCENGSLHGMTWQHLRAQLDGVELKKTYILNPLAPEFVPNRLRHAPYAPPEPIAYGKYGYTFARPTQVPPPWQQAHRQMAVAPHVAYQPPAAQRYYPVLPPTVGMLHGGLGIQANYPRYLGQPIAQLPPSFHSPKAISRGPKLPVPRPEGEEVGNVPSEAERVERDAQVLGKDPRLFTMMPPPPLSRVAPQGAPYPPRLVYHSAYGPVPPVAGYKLPAYPPQLLQQQAMLGVSQQQRLAVAQQQALAAGAHGLLGQQSQLSPGHLQLREARAALQSPNRSSPGPGRGSSQSPARTPLSSPKVEFLPKAVNVKTPPLSKPVVATSQPAGQPLHASYIPPPQLPQAPPITQPYLSTNPFLQRELYSYILQTEGQRAAEMFVQQSLQRDQTLLHQMQLIQRQQLLQQQQQQQFLPHQGQPVFMPGPPLGLTPRHPALNASDLEKQWQEESMRVAAHSQQAHSQPLFINPNLHTLAHDATTTARRQSPFGDGPQPYSRLNEVQKQEMKQSAVHANTNPLSVDCVAEPSPVEKELGNFHVDSPVALSPGGSRIKAPLYMRRVGQSDSASGPRLSYASALRAPTTNIEDIPDRTPQTVGPFTPEDNNFFLNRFQPRSADSTASSIGGDPLELLKNLKVQESPKDNGHGYPQFPFQ